MTLECAVEGCSQAAEVDHFTCTLPDHRKAEDDRRQGRSAFQDLQRRLRKDNVPTTSRRQFQVQDVHTDEAPSNDENMLAESNGSKPAKIKLARRYTHNEQLFVYSCGVIISRATLFSSEGILSVKVSFHTAVVVSILVLNFDLLGISQSHISEAVATSNLYFLRQSLSSTEASSFIWRHLLLRCWTSCGRLPCT